MKVERQNEATTVFCQLLLKVDKENMQRGQEVQVCPYLDPL